MIARESFQPNDNILSKLADEACENVVREIFENLLRGNNHSELEISWAVGKARLAYSALGQVWDEINDTDLPEPEPPTPSAKQYYASVRQREAEASCSLDRDHRGATQAMPEKKR